jgi:hypothetical protein
VQEDYFSAACRGWIKNRRGIKKATGADPGSCLGKQRTPGIIQPSK